MKPYKRLTIICSSISLFSFIACLCLHYLIVCDDTDFWVNVCLAIFGSSLLTSLSSIVLYFHEKRVTLENFMYHCRQLLHFLNKYQDSMPLSEKMRFFLDYHDLDKSAWDATYGNIDFFLERFTGNRAYIYKKLYHPILLFNQAVGSHAWHFRWYFDGSGKNDSVMEMFVAQLEQHLLIRSEQSIPTDYDASGKAVSFMETTSVESKLVHEILQELNGKYYDIMYGKRNRIVLRQPAKTEISIDSNTAFKIFNMQMNREGCAMLKRQPSQFSFYIMLVLGTPPESRHSTAVPWSDPSAIPWRS